MQVNRRILYTSALSTGSVAFSPTSVQSSNFIARTTGLTDARKTLYDAMITGIVNDLGGNTAISTWPILDALYITAADSSGNSLLNLVGASFPLTVNGGVTFTADNGYVSNGSTGYLDTGFTPSTAGGNYALNGAAFGVYILGNRTSFATTTIMGASSVGPSIQSILNPLNSAGAFLYEINSVSLFPSDSTSTAAGFTSIVRASSSVVNSYKNNSSTLVGTHSDGVGASMPAVSFFVLANNNNTVAGGFSSVDQVSAAYISGALTGAQHLALSTRINTYMTALGINVY